MTQFLTKNTCQRNKFDNAKDNFQSTNKQKLQMSIP